MAHNYQKRWVFTWNADESGQLINYQSLQDLLNDIVKEGVFQKERGKKTSRVHFQGRFEIKGPRIGKKKLLKLFSNLGCVKNLTFSAERVHDSTKYCTKLETQIEGPWFVGTDSYRTKNNSMTISLLVWQKQLLEVLESPLGQTFRSRKVI